ncbi:MAG: SDR family oxidoreductase [Litorimonas sp.]
MPKSKNPVMLITGASAGIGAAIAREYAVRGWDLVLTARRTDRLDALGAELSAEFDVKTYSITADLFDMKAVPKLISAIKAKGLKIDGVVNNAGYGHPGLYLDSEWKDHARFNHLMVEVPCELTHALLPDMIKNGFGRVMNIASLAGHMPGSRGHTLYAASKSYLVKFSESLNLELSGTGVNVSALCPGFTYTEFHDVNGTREAMNKLPAFMMMDADECAQLGVEALERNRAVYITGRVNKFLAVLARWLPTSMTQSLMARNSDKFRKT